MRSKKPLKVKRWSAQELAQFNRYVTENSHVLTAHFLTNVVAGHMRFRKPKCYFIDMGKRLGRSSKLCKSKFQKLEHKVYTELLGFPEAHYKLFCYLRTQSADAVDHQYIRGDRQRHPAHGRTHGPSRAPPLTPDANERGTRLIAYWCNP